MWYLRNAACSCKHIDPVSTCLCRKYIKFCSQTFEIGGEDDNGRRSDVNRRLLVQRIEKSLISVKSVEKFF